MHPLPKELFIENKNESVYSNEKGRCVMGVYKRKNIWYIDYAFEGRRIRRKIGANKKLAETILQKRKVEIAEEKHLDIRRVHKIKFNVFSKTYYKLHSLQHKKESTAKREVSLLKILNSFFGEKHLHEITPMMVEKFIAHRRQTVSDSTINREIDVFKNIFTKAVEWGKITKNPIQTIKKLKVKNERLRYLEREEINLLLNKCAEHLRPIIIVALNTGMRKGEILGLKWHDVDFKRDNINLLDTKNYEKRTLAMNSSVRKALFGVRKTANSPYIFCNKKGKPLRDVKKSFHTALRKAGIVNFRFHDLRHTFASQLVMIGIDLNTVRELLGHKSLQMTLRYAHLSPFYRKQSVEKLALHLDTNTSQNKNIKETVKKDISVTDLLTRN